MKTKLEEFEDTNGKSEFVIRRKTDNTMVKGKPPKKEKKRSTKYKHKTKDRVK